MFTKQQHLFKTNCLGWLQNIVPFACQVPHTQAMPAGAPEKFCLASELEAGGRQWPAMTPSTPHLQGRRSGALYLSPLHHGKEEGGRLSSGTCARFHPCTLEKYQPSNTTPFSPLACIHSLPLRPGFIWHYSALLFKLQHNASSVSFRE